MLDQLNKNTFPKRKGVKFSFGITQKDINSYVEGAYKKTNTEDYKKYAEVEDRLLQDVADDIDLSGYVHALRDNDIRHIRNSHGENTNEKYPVTQEDIAKIPEIVQNYDKVYVKTNSKGQPGVVYVKVSADNVVYYLEAATTQYHNEKLLVNKQMIKTGINEIPNLYGLTDAINKKEGSSQYLADLREIREAYVQDVKENYPISIVNDDSGNVNNEILSAEGKVVLGDTTVQIADVQQAGGGKLTVRLADGRTADSGELSFPDQGTEELYRTVARVADNAEAAKMLIEGYYGNNNPSVTAEGGDSSAEPAPPLSATRTFPPVSGESTLYAREPSGGVSAQVYARAVEQLVFYGKHQIPMEQLVAESPYVQQLTVAQRNTAYQLGEAAGNKKMDASQSAVNETYAQAQEALGQEGNTAKKTNTVTLQGYGKGELRGAAKLSYQLAQQIAAGVQGDIVIYNGGKEWGSYDADTDTIYLNGNIKWQGKTMLAFTLAHELVHRAKAGSPAQYRAFTKFLLEQYGKQGSDLRGMIAHQMYAAKQAGRKLTREQALEEVFCDAAMRMLIDTDAGKKLAQWGAQSSQNKGFLEKVKTILENILNRLRSYFAGVDPDSMEAQEFAKFDENAKQILADMFVDMSRDAGQKLSTIKQAGMLDQLNKNTAQEGGVKYKRPNNNDSITQDDVKALQKIERKSINQFSSEEIVVAQKWARMFWDDLNIKSPFFRAWFGDWRANEISEVTICTIPPYIATNEARKNNRGTFENADTGWKIAVSREGETNTISHSGKDKLSEMGLSGIQELVKNAVLLNSEVHEHHGNNPENDLITFDHKLYALGKNATGDVSLYRVTVEEYFQSKKEPANKKFHNLKHIEKIAEVTGGRTFGKNRSGGSTNGNSAITYSVADVVNFVKRFDSEYTPAPIVSRKMVNEDGTPKIYYHGTNAVWTTYDLSKNVNQMWGNGIYLAETEERAKLYGDNVIPLYVKALYDNRDAKRLGVQRDHVKMKNGDLLVFSPTQIKSATDNIGTFDGANPNIHYKTAVAEDLSPRELLVRTVEGMVANSAEWEQLQKYRRKIKELNAAEAKVERLGKELQKLYFPADGQPRDNDLIRNLQWQRDEAVKLLNKYDSQLLNLENTKPIRDIVARMRKASFQEGFQRAKTYYREKGQQREEDIRQQYRESRRAAVERHDKAQIRQSIRKDVERLNSLLNKGNKQKNVKQELKEFAGIALRTAQGHFLKNYNEYDMVRNGLTATMNREQQQIFQRCRELMAELADTDLRCIRLTL